MKIRLKLLNIWQSKDNKLLILVAGSIVILWLIFRPLDLTALDKTNIREECLYSNGYNAKLHNKLDEAQQKKVENCIAQKSSRLATSRTLPYFELTYWITDELDSWCDKINSWVAGRGSKDKSSQ